MDRASNITLPVFDLNAILVIGPIAFVVIVEHIGHLLVVSNITGENYNDKLAASLLGNGLGTAVSGFLGGPALTSIAENIGIMGVSRVYSTRVFWYTAGFALVLGGFCPKLAMLINTIPTCVLGGVSLMLFGLIAGNGLSLLVDSKVDFSKNRNLMIAAGSLIPGIGMMTMGVSIPLGSFQPAGAAAGLHFGRRVQPGAAQGGRSRRCCGRDRRRSCAQGRRQSCGQGCERDNALIEHDSRHRCEGDEHERTKKPFRSTRSCRRRKRAP